MGVLFVDDDEESRRSLLRALLRLEFNFSHAEAGDEEEALTLFTQNSPEVVVLDLELDSTRGPQSGLELLTKFLELDSSIRVIVLTAHNSEEFGLEALRRGAGNFLSKPCDPRHLKALLEDGVQFSLLKRRLRVLERQIDHSVVGLYTQNEKMKRVLEEVKFSGSNNQPVLLLGETGTGKGVIAKAIHQLHRPGKTFIRAQPSYGNFDLVHSELFGHDKGAFTGALHERKGLIEDAHEGTLFLDEIDSLPQETQVALLNVIQEGTFRRVGSNRERHSKFRLIAATNRTRNELKTMLREDLFHRIAHHVIELPPLRERKEDIPLLAEMLVREVSGREKLKVNQISPQALQKLSAYSWPGNIRELGAAITQAAFRAKFSGRTFIEVEDIQIDLATVKINPIESFRSQVDAFEAELLRNTMKIAEHNISEVGRRLHLERSQLKRMLKRHGLL